MMSRIIALFVLITCTLQLNAQNATLTKDETVNYIHRKMMETEGFQYTMSNSSGRSGKLRFTLIKSKLSDNGKLNISYVRESVNKDFMHDYYEYTFNPMHIKSMNIATEVAGAPVAYIMIRLTGVVATNVRETFSNSSIYRPGNGSSNNVDYVKIPFLQSDTSNFAKIKKALEHLQALLKAEDDPFGN